MLKVLCLGDIVGKPGRAAIKQFLPKLRDSTGTNLVIANGENASGGLGIVEETIEELRAAGVEIITLGDHAFQRKEIQGYLETSSKCLRPANYPAGVPGKGWTDFTLKDGTRIGIMNLIGRVFIGGALDCPFTAAEKILGGSLEDCPVLVCDMHAEATSEKLAMGRFLDGRVSFVFGTHSHVQTADEQILPGGTAYITDLGMCGSSHGVLGMDTDVSLKRFITGMPAAYRLAKGSPSLNGALVEIDSETGKALSIARISASEERIMVGGAEI